MASLQEYIQEVNGYTAADKEAVEAFRLRFLSKKGVLADLFAAMKTIPADERKAYGQQVNELKVLVEEKLQGFQAILEAAADAVTGGPSDLSLPATAIPLGSRHPISLIRNRIISIFSKIGFNVSDGPEIEDDWHNFTALNFPENHPARDMQDTFFIEMKGGSESIALRTHTSSVQVRVMETTTPPIRSLMPGRVYRNEAISARAHCFFHQVEGLYIDKDVTFADMKQTLLYFSREMFGADTKIRLRPSYFPFTEPSAEMDVTCEICKGKGCNVCKYTGWLEIMGCGMVDPNVLKNCGIDPEVYTGYAFGMGVERIAMLKYGVKDLRLFSENDIRFLQQFTAE